VTGLALTETTFGPVFICVDLCSSVAGLTKPFVYKGLLTRWTATVSGTVSNEARAGTIRRYWQKNR
jgi:hypothetical protein